MIFGRVHFGAPVRILFEIPRETGYLAKGYFCLSRSGRTAKDGREGKRGVIGQPAMKIEW